jgi:hypothetical protein
VIAIAPTKITAVDVVDGTYMASAERKYDILNPASWRYVNCSQPGSYPRP